MGDFLAIVKEKNFIEVVSRSINQVRSLPVQTCQNTLFSQVIIITVDDPKVGSLNPASVIDSLESVESMAWPNPLPERCHSSSWSATLKSNHGALTHLLRSLRILDDILINWENFWTHSPSILVQSIRIWSSFTMFIYSAIWLLRSRESLDLSGGIPSSESYSFVGLLKRLKHRWKTSFNFQIWKGLTDLSSQTCRGLLKETRLPMEEYFPSGLT